MEKSWMVLGCSFLIAFSYLFSIYIYPPMIPYFIKEFNLSYTEASFPMSLLALPPIFLALPSWLIIFRMGLKKAGILGLLICGISQLAVFLADLFIVIVLGRIIFGFGAILLAVVSYSMIAGYYPKEKQGLAMGVKSADMPIAVTVTSFLFPALIATYGWKFGFITSALLLFVSTALFLFLFTDKKAHLTNNRVFEGFYNKDIWLLGMAWGFSSMSQAAFSTWAGTFFADFRKIPVSLAFSLVSVYYLTQIPLNFLMGQLSDKAGKRKKFITIPLLVSACSFLVISIVPANLLFYLVFALLSASSFRAPFFAVVPEILINEEAGLGFSILFTFGYIGILLGPFLVGLVQDLFPGGFFVFSTMGFFSFMAFLFMNFVETR